MSAPVDDEARRARALLDAEGRAAELFDLSEDDAIAQLARLADPKAWSFAGLPGISQAPIQGGPRVKSAETLFVRFKPGVHMWIEDLFALVEQCASTQVFAVLKRPDEKWVTEAAYDNPKFVEDIVRDLAVALEAEERIVWYQVNSENYESIHNHNAYAFIEKDKRAE